MDIAAIRGFNYQPSYGSSGLEVWQQFDPQVIELELRRGKTFFPGMNALRFWLSWHSFVRGPDVFCERFETVLTLADRLGLAVMPCLFNRWHSGELDYGGTYLEDFYWRHYKPKPWPTPFNAFLERIVGGHAGDPRIFAWDLCNEPFGNSSKHAQGGMDAEYGWLADLYQQCKDLGARAPITVGIHQNDRLKGIAQVEPISDLLCIHPYWIHQSMTQDDFRRMLDEYVAFAERVGKPLLANETCWGSLDDAERSASIRFHLCELKARGIGWLAYALHHSLVADLHRPEFGPLGEPGNLAFIEADGTLRAGHDVFNDY